MTYDPHSPHDPHSLGSSRRSPSDADSTRDLTRGITPDMTLDADLMHDPMHADSCDITCGDAFALLSGYVDQSLSPGEAASCERHLFRCAACRERYRQMRALRQDLLIDCPPQPLPLRLELALTNAAERFINGQPTTSSPYLPPLPLPSATPSVPLPLHLDLDLQALAARFIAAEPLTSAAFDPEAQATAEAANTDLPSQDHDLAAHASEWQQVHQWLRQRRAQIALVACVLVATLSGMGVLAYRHGNVPSLTHRDYHVSGLPDYGNALLHQHRAYAADHLGEPAYNADTLLAFLFSKHIPYPVPLSSPAFGVAMDGRVLSLLDTPTPVVRFNHPTGPVSQVVLPTAFALDALGDVDPDATQTQCAVPRGERCFDDSLGASLCIRYGAALTTVWIASMPSERLLAAISGRPDRPLTP
jgi:anti-sigma factor RsiW